MNIVGIDHLVLYATDVERTCEFYVDVLGAGDIEEGKDDRVAISFGTTKLNLHPAGDEYVPHATTPTPGGADFCLLVDEPIEEIAEKIHKAEVPIVHGPTTKVGARGKMQSVYVHDPDGNLVEFAAYGGQS